jgi:hypothetical protein
MKHWFDWKHLRVAEYLNGTGRDNLLVLYFKHMWVGFREAGKQFLMCIASIIHAIFPPLFNFKLLEIVINQAIGLHKFLPQHPDWKKLKDELNKDNK